MYTTIAYRSTIVAGASNASISALAGDGDTVQNSMYLPRENMRLVAAYGQGTGMDRLQLVTPRLSGLSPLQIHPLVQAADPPTDANFDWEMDNSIDLFQSEPMDFQSTNTDAGNQVHSVIAFLQISPPWFPKGPKLRVRATSATAATAGAWTTVTPTFGSTLPTGKYAVIGLVPISTTMLAARLVLPDNSWRPGVTGIVSTGHRQPEQIRSGSLGALGQFSSVAFPQVQILCRAADATQVFLFDLVRVSDRP